MIEHRTSRKEENKGKGEEGYFSQEREPQTRKIGIPRRTTKVIGCKCRERRKEKKNIAFDVHQCQKIC